MKDETSPTADQTELKRRERYRKAAELLAQWSREDDGYNERVSQILAEELKDSSLKCRGDCYTQPVHVWHIGE